MSHVFPGKGLLFYDNVVNGPPTLFLSFVKCKSQRMWSLFCLDRPECKSVLHFSIFLNDLCNEVAWVCWILEILVLWGAYLQSELFIAWVGCYPTILF